MNDSELEDNQKEEMEKLLKAMIGLLVNLRYECRNFSLESNKYLNELMNTIDNRYPEHFNEIYETLHSITSKISE
ncbi:MAG: hypothetical protein KBD76_16500 [Bacteriovorax sp.]|nr:hypothetical protein [Bacteriovorax sp.]